MVIRVIRVIRGFRRVGKLSKDYIDWWYKNGDEGKQHYSIPYENSQKEKSLFYVDFIIRMKNGKVFLFDTKTENILLIKALSKHIAMSICDGRCQRKAYSTMPSSHKFPM